MPRAGTKKSKPVDPGMSVHMTPGGRMHLEVKDGSPAATMPVAVGDGTTHMADLSNRSRVKVIEDTLAEVRRQQVTVKTAEEAIDLQIKEHYLIGVSEDAVYALKQEVRLDQVNGMMPSIMKSVKSQFPKELFPDPQTREDMIAGYEDSVRAQLEQAARSDEMIKDPEITAIHARVLKDVQAKVKSLPGYPAWAGARAGDTAAAAARASKLTLEERVRGAQDDVAVETASMEARLDPSAAGTRTDIAVQEGYDRGQAQNEFDLQTTGNVSVQTQLGRAAGAGKSAQAEEIARRNPPLTPAQEREAYLYEQQTEGIGEQVRARAADRPVPNSMESRIQARVVDEMGPEELQDQVDNRKAREEFDLWVSKNEDAGWEERNEEWQRLIKKWRTATKKKRK